MVEQITEPQSPPSHLPDIVGRPAALLLTTVSLLLTLPVFEPNAVWPLACFAFAPWIMALALARKTRWMHALSFAFLLVFWLVHGRFIAEVSGTAHAVYACGLAAQSMLAPWAVRHLYRNRGLCMTIAFPVAWTGMELFRSLGLMSSTWFFLAHSQIRLPIMIQIADLVGSLGVTFLVASINGWLADLAIMVYGILKTRPSASSLRGKKQSCGSPGAAPTPPGCPVNRCRRAILATAIAAGLTLSSLAYGVWRLTPATSAVGPRVAVLQGDFPTTPGRRLDASIRASDEVPAGDELDQLLRSTVAGREADKRLIYLDLLGRAAAESPDLMILPEAPWDMVLNHEYRESPLMVRNRRPRLQHEEWVKLASRYETSILLTSKSLTPQPPGAYPPTISHNSAWLYAPGRPEPERRDKIGLMLLGEYLPFRDNERLHPLYRLLNDGPWNPWGRGGKEYIDDAGTEFRTFAVNARRDGKNYSFATAICYEDAIPWLYRRFVVGPDGRKRVDFMVTMSNAGCFGHSSQQPQHLAVCAFRAIENRVWIARACNTGVSGFIDPAGRWHDLVGCADADPRPGGMGLRVAEAKIDPRVTFYSRHGDWLAWTCLALSTTAILDSLVMRIRRRKGDNTISARQDK